MSRIAVKRRIDFEHKLYQPENPREIPHSLYPAGFLTALSKKIKLLWPCFGRQMDSYNYGTDATDTLVFS
jgi:hypothetical protein